MLTFEEMRQRYDGEWVLLVDYEIDAGTNALIRDRVIAHDYEVQKIEEVDRELGLTNAAYECFREPGGGTILLL
ncbi:hypothetical protein [Fimbriimonas ginsengisoli]|uniref:DUF5678 domain-containing protein n=1 Tax=Fimbriimonas ginsengisoli Gsoil 348 TaxID=661478 RepID=A0A068NKY4_FIMGI|nr:hypothetical protein [Fimbriimonas ginsengisoli]AIE84253.1 hypothetical protein OP10G_0885 [Fimbriimonas ginsengisoli Gsoil 348]